MEIEKNKEKYSKKYIFYILILYLMTFQNLIQNYISIFQYIDEIIALFGVGLVVYKIIKNNLKLYKSDFIILSCLLILLIIGFIPIFIYHYQNIKAGIIDYFLIIKFFFAYLLSKIFFNYEELNKKSKIILKNIKAIVIILFVFSIANYLMDLFPSEVRFGIKTNQLFYEHPTYLVAICIFLFSNYVMFSKKILDVFNFILLIIMITTLRVKAIGIVVVTLFLMIYVAKRNKKILLGKLIVIGVICVIIAYPQIKYYFIELDDNARKALLETSIEIANDYFPLGTGFGTFGSFESAESYSKVYELYEINNVWGLQKGNAFFVSDSFWPMILGQFGYMGCLIYCICLIVIFGKVQGEYNKKGKFVYLGKLICIAYLIISSTSESAFVNPIAIPLAIVLGM